MDKIPNHHDLFLRFQKLYHLHREPEEDTILVDSQACVCDGQSRVFIHLPTQTFKVCPHCDPKPHCELCEGTGHRLQFDLETLKDTVIPNACECMDLHKAIAQANRAGIPPKYLNCHLQDGEGLTDALDSYLTAFQKEKIQTIYHKAQDFLSHTQSKPFLTLMGSVGTGKTHLAVSLLKYCLFEKKQTGFFVDFQMLLGLLREAYSQKRSEYQILKPLIQADILVLDEFGKIRTESEWQLEKLDDIVNARYNNHKVTIFTTNYLPPHLQYHQVSHGPKPSQHEAFWTQSLPERIGQRMYDRLLENSQFIDFIELPSFRSLMALPFLNS